MNDPIDRQVAELIRLLEAKGGSLEALCNLFFDGGKILDRDEIQGSERLDGELPPRLLYPPASAALVAEAEAELGFPFPALLKAVYEQIGNGGHALRLIGLEGGQGRFDDDGLAGHNVVEGYRKLRSEWAKATGRPWPEKMLPLNNGIDCNWIDAVDCGTPEGAIWRCDSGEFTQRLPTLDAYFRETIESLIFVGPDSD